MAYIFCIVKGELAVVLVTACTARLPDIQRPINLPMTDEINYQWETSTIGNLPSLFSNKVPVILTRHNNCNTI